MRFLVHQLWLVHFFIFGDVIMKLLVQILIRKLKKKNAEYRVVKDGAFDRLEIRIRNDGIKDFIIGITFRKGYAHFDTTLADAIYENRIESFERMNKIHTYFQFLRICIEDDKIKVKTDCHYAKFSDIERCLDRIQYLNTFLLSSYHDFE